jgi:hypothetical protein
LFAGLARLVARQPFDASAMNRACHLHTTGLDLPERRMISAVPQPSTVAKRCCPPHVLCGELRSETIASVDGGPLGDVHDNSCFIPRA